MKMQADFVVAASTQSYIIDVQKAWAMRRRRNALRLSSFHSHQRCFLTLCWFLLSCRQLMSDLQHLSLEFARFEVAVPLTEQRPLQLAFQLVIVTMISGETLKWSCFFHSVLSENVIAEWSNRFSLQHRVNERANECSQSLLIDLLKFSATVNKAGQSNPES